MIIARRLLRRAPAPSWRGLSTATDSSSTKRKHAARSRDDVDRRVALEALRVFHTSHGHAVVPPRFVVPTAESEETTWPRALQGVKLGDALQRLYATARRPGSEELREELRALGVEIADDDDDAAVAYKAFYWRATVLAALRAYKEVYGDLYVPRPFVVPSDSTGEQWPLAARGLRLGQQVHLLRKKAAEDADRIPEYQREALDEIDFAWDVMEHKWTTRFLPALTRYHELHGHCNVPQKFTVPSPTTSENDAALESWADLPQCHGYRLGSAVNKVRRGDSFTLQIVRYFDDLQALGFTFSSFDRNWNEKVLPALETFYDIYGHTHVGAYFEVPEDDPRWPRETWGMGLGFIVQNIRSRGDFFPQIMRDSDRLEAIEFVWNRAEVKWKQMVLPALETFVALHRHARVPASFVVPRESPWPQDAYDLRLGRIVTMPSARNRYANYIEIDRKRLERIGFKWSYVDENDGSESDSDSDDSDDSGDSDSEDSDSEDERH